MRAIRLAWRILTAPLRAIWNLPDTQIRWGSKLSSVIERRLGPRASLLPAAIFLGLMTVGFLVFPRRHEPIFFLFAVGSLLLTLYVTTAYVGRLILGEGEAGDASQPPREPARETSWLQRFAERFRSEAARLARRRDVDALLALSVSGDAKERAEAINRLWGLSEQLAEQQRTRLTDVARRAARDPDDGVRGQALFTLGALADNDDHDLLEAALNDASWFPRLAAAYALSWATPPARISSIGRLLDDEESMVRDQVAGIFRTIAMRETDDHARTEAIAALDDAGLPLSD